MDSDGPQRRLSLSSNSSHQRGGPLSSRALSASLPSPTTKDDIKWRDELARTRHELRLCRAELQACQLKLGIKPNLAPFGSSSPRRRASAGPEFSAHHDSTDPASHGEQRHGSLLRVAEHGSPWANGDSVAVKRSLAFNNDQLATQPDRPRSVSPRPRTNGSARVGSENPFFGNAGAARDRLINSAASSQSTSGKMISTLQSDILQLRSSLDTTRNQLRLSQRAVETLNRQNDDLKDTKTRLLQEIEGLKRTFERRERNTNDVLARAQTAETALETVQKEFAGSKQTMKALEEAARRAESSEARSMAAQDAVSASLVSMSRGFKDDVTWLRDDIAGYEDKFKTMSRDFRTLSEDKSELENEARSILQDMSNTVRATCVAHAQLARQARKDSEKVAMMEQEHLRIRRAIALETQNE
ncbi:hypothetical protein ACM66B_003542 [Microbotryomycetes sp. NB124-2]